MKTKNLSIGVFILLFHYFTSFSQAQSISQLYCGEPIFSTTRGQANSFTIADYNGCYSSSSSFNAGDRVFVFNKPSNSGRLCLNLFSEGADDLDFFLYDSSFRNCFAAKTGAVQNNRTREFLFDADPPLPAGNYYIVVDGYNSQHEDEFRLTATCGELDCNLATPITCGETRNENNYSAPNNISAYRINNSYQGGHTGPERLYYFDMPNSGTVNIELVPRSNSNDFELIL